MLVFIIEYDSQSVLESLVEGTVVAITREVRVVVGECMAVFAGVIFEPTLGKADGRTVGDGGCGGIGGLQ